MARQADGVFTGNAPAAQYDVPVASAANAADWGQGTARHVAATAVGTFFNAWANFGAGWQSAAYYKDSFGRVYLTGLIKSGTVSYTVSTTVGGTAFTLASGYRPASNTRIFVVMTTTAGNVEQVGQIRIDTAGNVNVCPPSGNGWVSLDGISFDI